MLYRVAPDAESGHLGRGVSPKPMTRRVLLNGHLRSFNAQPGTGRRIEVSALFARYCLPASIGDGHLVLVAVMLQFLFMSPPVNGVEPGFAVAVHGCKQSRLLVLVIFPGFRVPVDGSYPPWAAHSFILRRSPFPRSGRLDLALLSSDCSYTVTHRSLRLSTGKQIGHPSGGLPNPR